MANLQQSLPDARGLSEAQEAALGALREGNSFMAAARKAGIGRATLYRWVQSHPHFRAAYNLWQREMAESARARLLKMADKAVEVVEGSLARGDEKVALKMLRSLGILRRQRRGSVNPAVLDLRMRVMQHREEQRVTKGMIDHLLDKAGASPAYREQIARGEGTAELLKHLDTPSHPDGLDADETLDETDPPQSDSAPARDGAAEGDPDACNDQPPQDMRKTAPPTGPRLVDETVEVDSEPVSHPNDREDESQVVKGWRVGEQLNGTQ
jgi:transposase-like protein